MLSKTVQKIISKNKDILEKELSTLNEDKKYIFFSRFIHRYNVNDLIGLANITLSDYMIASLSSLDLENKLAFEDIATIILGNSSVIELDNSTNIYYYFFGITKLTKFLQDNKISVYYDIENDDFVFDFTNKKQQKECTKYLKSLETYIANRNCIIDMVLLCSKYNKYFVECALYAYSLKRLSEDIKKLNVNINKNEFYNKKGNIKSKHNNQNLDFNEHIKENYNIPKMLETAAQLNDTLKKEIKKANKRKNNLTKEIGNYKKLETWIEREKHSTEILSIPNCLFDITNEKLKLSILKNIYTHNMKLHKETNKKYQEINKSTKLQELFKRKKLNISVNDILLNKNIHEYDSMISILFQLSIKDADKIIEVLNNSNITILNQLNINTKKGYITTEMLNNNIAIFSEDSFKNYEENLDFFINNGFSVNNINRIENSLNLPNDLLVKNINYLKNYHLFSYRLTDSVLSNTEINKKIDFLLENGFEEPLKEDLSLLEYDINKYKRLILLNRVNTPLLEVSEIKKVLEQTPFIVKDSDIDLYLSNAMPKLTTNNMDKDTFLKELENYSFTKRTYNIDNIIISKQKVNHNILNIDTVTSDNINQILFSDMIISYERAQNIRKSFDSKKVFKKKK